MSSTWQRAADMEASSVAGRRGDGMETCGRQGGKSRGRQGTMREGDADMFGLFGGVKKNGELEHLIERIENNVANNYKDAAQEYLKEYEELLESLKTSGKLNEKQTDHYESLLQDLKGKLKGFTHKDQKPYWT